MSNNVFMLDTNLASYVIRNNNPALDKKLDKVGVGSICVSSITEAELRFGCLKYPKNTKLHDVVEAFLARVNRVSWGTEAAAAYASIRAYGEAEGFSLSNMDMLIGAHAASLKVTLITNDSAFLHFRKWITCDNWMV